MSEIARLTGVVWSPGAAFRDIAARPRWWPPLVILVLAGAIFIYNFTQRVGWERFFRQQAETNSRMQNMPADQREQTVAAQIKYGPTFAYVAAVVALPIMALVTAGVFLFLFRMLMSVELSFRQSLAIVCYSWVPTLFGSIMAFIMLYLKTPEDFDLNYPAPTNIGAFLELSSTPKWLLSLATSIDVVTLWTLALLATGFAAADRKISWGSSFACVFGTWAVYVLLKMGWAAAFG